MIDEYLINKKYKDEKNILKEEIYFGQILGFIIILLSTFNYFYTTDLLVSQIMVGLMIFGISLVIIGLIFPYLLYYPSQLFKFITNKIFNLIILIILLLIYILLIFPVGLFNRKKLRKKYGFYYWNDRFNGSSRGFEEKEVKYMNHKKLNRKNKSNKFENAISIIIYFITNKQYLFLPLIFIFIIIGLLFFFITSSVVAPMIYTIF